MSDLFETEYLWNIRRMKRRSIFIRYRIISAIVAIFLIPLYAGLAGFMDDGSLISGAIIALIVSPAIVGYFFHFRLYDRVIFNGKLKSTGLIVLYVLSILFASTLTNVVFKLHLSLSTLTTFTTFQIPAFGLMIAASIYYSSQFRRDVKNSTVIPLKLDSIKIIEDSLISVQRAAAEHELPLPNYSIWLDRRSSQFLPYVCAGRGRKSGDHLIIPRNFIGYLENEPEAGLAILAHETSHLIQRDASLWGFSDVLSAMSARAIAPLLVVNFIIAYFAAQANGFELQLQAFESLLVNIAAFWNSRWATIDACKASESLADSLSELLLGSASIRTAVIQLGNEPSRLHPEQSQRVLDLVEEDERTVFLANLHRQLIEKGLF